MRVWFGKKKIHTYTTNLFNRYYLTAKVNKNAPNSIIYTKHTTTDRQKKN